mgnify:CR=1 FL=1
MNKLPLLLALLAGTTAQAEIYRWVDENGVTQFSSSPPPEGEAEQVKINPPPKTDLNVRKQLEADMQELEDEREDRELAERKQQEEEKKRELAETNCRNAKSNLENLTVATQRLLKMPDGSYQRLTEEQRQEKLQEARKTIDEYCK